MAYYYDGVKCDTLAELNALRQSKEVQPMVVAHSDNSKQCSEKVVDQHPKFSYCKDCNWHLPYHKPGCDGPVGMTD